MIDHNDNFFAFGGDYNNTQAGFVIQEAAVGKESETMIQFNHASVDT